MSFRKWWKFYIKEKIDWPIGINYTSIEFKLTQFFLCCQSFDRRGQWIFQKMRVIQDKSKLTRVAMIWLRVKVNRTRLRRAARFARNEIKYQKSRESGLFQYNLYARTIACSSFIPLYKQKFYKSWQMLLAVPPRGGHFRNFWVGMCRWEPGTLNLYQS